MHVEQMPFAYLDMEYKTMQNHICFTNHFLYPFNTSNKHSNNAKHTK